MFCKNHPGRRVQEDAIEVRDLERVSRLIPVIEFLSLELSKACAIDKHGKIGGIYFQTVHQMESYPNRTLDFQAVSLPSTTSTPKI